MKPTKALNSPRDESFFLKVYEVARLIPYGRVSTYGAIARFLGTAGSARMVGWAMNQSHSQPHPVPAHRVVNRNGQLTGKHHFGGPDIMRDLLESEGVEIENDTVRRFTELFWDPAEAL
jgi:methylated-DNA-protein-cysteine methyltransferase-like protein